MKNPPESGGHAERVPKILSFDMDRYEGGTSTHESPYGAVVAVAATLNALAQEGESGATECDTVLGAALECTICGQTGERHYTCAVCRTRNLDLVRSIGADHGLDAEITTTA